MIIVVLSVLILSVLIYVLGILLSKSLRRSNNDILSKYGSPSFVIAGIREYKFVFDFILFGGYKRYSLENNILKLILLYKFVLLVFIISIIILMVMLVNSGK